MAQFAPYDILGVSLAKLRRCNYVIMHSSKIKNEQFTLTGKALRYKK